jgi:hypothetical protein
VTSSWGGQGCLSQAATPDAFVGDAFGSMTQSPSAAHPAPHAQSGGALLSCGEPKSSLSRRRSLSRACMPGSLLPGSAGLRRGGD